MRVYVKAQDSEGKTVKLGPVVINRSDSVAVVESKINAWLKANPPPPEFKINLPSGDAFRLSGTNNGQLDRNGSLVDAATAGGGRLELSGVA